MVRLIIIIVAFLVMIGGLIGGLYFWGIDPLQKFNELVGNAPAAPGQTVAESPKAPAYVEFGLLIVPVVQDREVRKQAEMILRLEVPHNKQDVVAQNLPRLQNAYLQDMMSFLPRHLRGTDQLDHDVIRRRLTQLSERVLGPGLVRDVLIEQSTVK
ncbi:flagellar basal body-associated protein FliL [Magnetospirillum sp. UT-4]|uniref:flagellar basal body-associated protein FliL n=1 Tax=Magnetospirillum sp. UT-4 TaxID=2681467 RepID=UPI00137DE228|nr:flagellar basal body-associated protein FliL [Magnetospirillum sp. UT-4]CAA7617824.1 conserved hypothetical protein [Magnetospirillum sp. UT-4]